MRKNSKPVEYYVFPDEGHGFARPENRLAFYAAAEQFLAKYLGGRAQPPRRPKPSCLAQSRSRGAPMCAPTGADTLVHPYLAHPCRDRQGAVVLPSEEPLVYARGSETTRRGGRVSYITAATTTPERNVSAAIEAIAAPMPSASASTPAASAPTA